MKRFLFVCLLSLVYLSSSSQQEFPFGLLDFDGSDNGFLELMLNPEDSTNLWQIGVPSKLYFDSAYSPIHAIVTDTVNAYPINNFSTFEVDITEGLVFNNFIEIVHKFDTDTLLDGGLIEVSWDEGDTWNNIITDTSLFINETYPVSPLDEQLVPSWMIYNFEIDNLYSITDTLYDGNYGFSGKSDGWVTTKFSWWVMPSQRNKNQVISMKLRFTFISDSINTNKEGWMIDNIRYYHLDLGSSVDEFLKPNFDIFPNPSHGDFTISLDKKYKNAKVEMINSFGQIVATKYIEEDFKIANNNIDNGVYWIRLLSNNEVIGVQRLVISK